MSALQQQLGDRLQPIVPGMFLYRGEKGGRFPYGHVFIVRGEEETLIDTGCGQDRLRELLGCWRPDRVIISHSHPDHVSGLWQLAGEARVSSPAQRSEIFWRFEPMSVRFVGAELASTWITYITDYTGVREAAADDHFADGDELDLGPVKLRAIHAPGHLDDHYVLYEPTHGVALTFDIELTSFGPWYGHVESGIEESLASIRAVADLRPRLVVSSHAGVISEEIPRRLADYARVVEDRDRRLLALLERPRALSDLVDASPFYGGHPYARPVLRHWEGNMISKHLVRLERRGAVAAEGGRWRRRER